jgi:hypothetical protein
MLPGRLMTPEEFAVLTADEKLAYLEFLSQQLRQSVLAMEAAENPAAKASADVAGPPDA